MNNYLNIVNSKPLQNGSMNIGEFPSETASIAYDGTLLPTGTASYGSELVVNGGFDTDTSWTKGANWTISGGVATFTAGVVNSLISTSSVQASKSYLVTYEVKSHTGNMRLFIGDGWFYLPTVAGTYTSIVASGASTLIYLRPLNTTDSCIVDNVSVKEVLINPNLRYLKNSGKDKTPALVESGQGKFFNGTNQYIDTGIVPNQAQGTLVTRFTYATGMTTKVAVGGLNSGQRFYVGVNSTGKIGVAIGTNAFDTAGQFITDTLVNGQSYHVALKYVGINIEVFVDSVKRLTFSVSGFNPSLGTFFVGSSHTNLTPTLYFNNVIDETYYYDVALTDAQIGLLYSYPEKVKAYNGAIVPDIGSEANCKLFLPLCENSGSNVVNVAVARSAAITISSETPTIATYVGGVLTPTASIQGRLDIRPLMTNILVDDFLEFEVNMVAVNANTKITLSTNAGGYTSVATIIALVGSNKVIGKIPAGSTVVYCMVYADYVNGTAPCTIGTYTVKEISGAALVNYTTAMHTSAAKLSYGAQCTAWKRDSLGVLLGMSNGLSFDGGVSVKYLDTPWIPNSAENFVFEQIWMPNPNQALEGTFYSGVTTARLSIGTEANGNARFDCGSTSTNTLGLLGFNYVYSHIVVVYKTATKTVDIYVNNVKVKDTLVVADFVSNGSVYRIASGLSNQGSKIRGYFKVHKGAQYAKFDIAKAWSRAQKTIAKLGA